MQCDCSCNNILLLQLYHFNEHLGYYNLGLGYWPNVDQFSISDTKPFLKTFAAKDCFWTLEIIFFWPSFDHLTLINWIQGSICYQLLILKPASHWPVYACASVLEPLECYNNVWLFSSRSAYNTWHTHITKYGDNLFVCLMKKTFPLWLCHIDFS